MSKEVSRLKKALKELTKRWIEIPQRFRREQEVHLVGDLYFYEHGVVIKGKKGYKRYRVSKFNYKRLDVHKARAAYGKLIDYMLIFKLIDDKIKPKDILGCRNADIRRHILKEYGVKKFFRQMGARRIHRDGASELFHLDMKHDAEPLVMVKVVDPSTKEVYLLQVPSDMKTCKQAIAWTFGMTAEEYDPKREA